jgi:hypothetical protein
LYYLISLITQSSNNLLPCATCICCFCDVGLPGEHGLAHAGHVGLAHILGGLDLDVADHALPLIGRLLQALFLTGALQLGVLVRLAALLNLAAALCLPVLQRLSSCCLSLVLFHGLLLRHLEELALAEVSLLLCCKHALLLLLVHVILKLQMSRESLSSVSGCLWEEVIG